MTEEKWDEDKYRAEESFEKDKYRVEDRYDEDKYLMVRGGSLSGLFTVLPALLPLPAPLLP
ncbi:hypothetical protein P171DRAFT_436364 [Karstenula rhodostoma CBS 690.94]|uniref:Uncharacterized protein n=1 Tax=Karstenula rhodostoma CBS 690.94 TaxID=1392251 RepID=A0A9P4U6D8_9PLEO|nr:hypothetical protein P171DRAFT_436364 [Karstenula rhodostoma CBS 690.94]